MDVEARASSGFQLMRPAAPEGHHPSPSGPFSYADIVFDAWLKHVVAYCGKNKAMVYYEAQRSAPPAFASLGSFTMKFSSLNTFHTTFIPGPTRTQPSMKMGRGEGGRTLKHGLHPGFS